MTKINKYTATQEVFAAYVDLEFSWDAIDIMDFLDEYKLNYRIGKITNPDHTDAQHYYLEMLGGPTEEGGEDMWMHVPHHTYLVIMTGEGDRVGASSVPAEEFKRIYKKVETLWDES